MYKALDLLGYKIINHTVSDINIDVHLQTIINTINPHSYCIAKTDNVFSDALKNADILLPDGDGIVLAARIIKKQKINKIAGADIHKHLLTLLNINGGKVFYLGATNSTLQKISERLSVEFPNISFCCYSPPYKSEFEETDSVAMSHVVNTFMPDVLFVGMTAPKQEKWVHQNKHRLNARIICSIGAVFDFYAGTVKRPSKIFINLKIEWLGRLLKEPKRMWKRNFISTPIFLIDVIREYVKNRNTY